MADYGFTPAGFAPKTTAVIRDELRALWRGQYGAGCPLGSQTLLGTLTSLVADRCSSLWDLLQALVSAGDPDGAEDAALEVIAAYQLVLREGSSPSATSLVLTGAATTVVAAGATVVISGTATAFATTTAATLIAVPAWAASTAVAIGDRRTKDGRCYLCTVGGVTGVTGPTGTSYTAVVADGAASWRYLGEGVAVADVEALCTESGPVAALAYSLTEIGTSVAGWTGAANPLDAQLGQLRQTDNSLRVTRENALARAGAGTPEAIRADVLAVSGVRACTVFANRGETVDADGVPSKSVEVLVTGGDDAAIAAAIWSSVSGSSGLHGTELVTIVDSEGVDQQIRFSRPTIVPVYVSITVRRDPLRYLGATEVVSRLVSYGDAQQTGVDVDALALAGQVVPRLTEGGLVREQVVGVTGATSCTVGLAPSPIGLSVAISRRQWADLDSSRVTVLEVSP